VESLALHGTLRSDQTWNWVTWFLGHWVTGSQNVTQFHVWFGHAALSVFRTVLEAALFTFRRHLEHFYCISCFTSTPSPLEVIYS